MQSRIAEIRATGTEVLAISVDPAEVTRERLGSVGLEFPLLADPELQVIDSFGMRHSAGGMGGIDIARSGVFLIDGTGSVVWRELTDNYRVRLRPERLLKQIAALP